MKNVRKVINVGASLAITIPAKMVREKKIARGDFVVLNNITKVIMKEEKENYQKELEVVK